ncbi:MAG: DUF4270 domain-containing protein [Prevotella sp.]|nr:DUF4270 domain-containing protein [Prevotella sp.]MBQ7716861.1 DUF4270 domain-containing protein [Prevotella sp.]
MKTRSLAALLLLITILTACDDTTESIGASLTDNMDHLQITTDTFSITTRSIIADSVLSRNTTGYLGKIKDPETGAYITGDFMMQFNTLEDYFFPTKDSIESKDELGNVYVDSCEIRLYYDDFYGDSLAAMKLSVYELAKPYEEGQNYYSNYDPFEQGYIREDGIVKSKMYALTNMGLSDSLRKSSSYSPNIRIPLNDPYTDKDGKTYKNYGTYILQKYYENPEITKNSYNFIHQICPGFYVKIQEGLGSMATIYNSQLNLYFRYRSKYTRDNTTKDTTYVGTTTFAGTEEVLQHTHITNDKQTISTLAADNSCTYLKTPAGIFTEMTLPVDEIVYNHENDTLNTAKITLSRINNNTHGDYTLSTPSTLLIVEKDSMYTFFESNKIADNKLTYLSTFANNGYTFNNISGLIRHMAEAKEKGLQSNPNWLALHPDWNKVVLVPVSTEYVTVGQNQVLAKVSHDMSMTSTRLVGGSANPNQPIRISVIYSKFSNK